MRCLCCVYSIQPRGSSISHLQLVFFCFISQVVKLLSLRQCQLFYEISDMGIKYPFEHLGAKLVSER